MMWEQWLKEVKNKESRAILLWSRNEKFLRKKKHEDEQNSCTTVTETTWEEKLQLNRKNNNRRIVDPGPSQFHYTHLPQSGIRDCSSPLYPYPYYFPNPHSRP